MDATTPASLAGIERQIEHALEFLRNVFTPDDWIEIRLLPCKVSRWFRLSDDDTARKTLRWAMERNAAADSPQNVYVGANPRSDSGKKGDASVPLARVVFVDFDGGTTVEEALKRIRKAGLPEPSLVNESGGGNHPYWLLDEPITDMAAWTATVKGIIAAVGSDKTIFNPERIMRLPGSRNVKPERKGRPWCRTALSNGTRHPFAAFPVKASFKKPAAGNTQSPVPSSRRRTLCDIGRQFIETGRVERPRSENLFVIWCDMKAKGWHVEEAIKATMERAHNVFEPAEQERIDDLERQIRNAFKQDREPGHSSHTPEVPAEPAPPPRRRLVLLRASEIECTAINWLWPQRIVGDGLTIITGPVGISKSLISVDVAGRVTTGGKWPDGTGHAPQGSVILFGAEDDAGKVVVPRLMAAGADLQRVHVCQGTVVSDDEEDDEVAAVILERNIEELRAALDDVADCRLIVFDPLPDYLAADENKSAEVRKALVPLARLAQERNVAIVAVLHQNKKNDLTTVQRIAGSSAFAQIARVVLSIGTHPEDVDKASGKRRVMLVSKNNYGERDVGQAYEIESRANDIPGLVWHAGILTMDADEIARRPTGGQEHDARRGEAVDALRDLLSGGEQNAAAITERLQDMGLGRRQVDHAANALNIIKSKRRDGWYWRLPAREPRSADVQQRETAFDEWAPENIRGFATGATS